MRPSAAPILSSDSLNCMVPPRPIGTMLLAQHRQRLMRRRRTSSATIKVYDLNWLSTAQPET